MNKNILKTKNECNSFKQLPQKKIPTTTRKTENTLTAYRVNPKKSKLSNLKLKFFYRKKPVKELKNKTVPYF